MSQPASEPNIWGALGPLLEHGFTVIPNVVLRDETLSGNAKLAWALIYDYRYRKQPARMDALQRDLGVGEKPTRAAVRELEDFGLIRRKRHGQGLPNSYHLTIPLWMIDPGQNLPEGGSRTAPGEDPFLKDLGEDRDVGAKAPPSAGAGLERSARARNLVFDALVEATNANPADGGMIGKAANSIRTAMEDTLTELRQGYLAQNPHEDEVPKDVVDELVAGQIRMRADLYRRLRPEWELTPTALAKHWNRIPTWQERGGLSPTELGQLRDEDILGG